MPPSGPNRAADPIVTRFNPSGGKLQFAAIQRRDTGEWAIPGALDDGNGQIPRKLMLLYGMLDAESNVTRAASKPQSPQQSPVPPLQLPSGPRISSGGVDPSTQRQTLVKELFAQDNGTRECPRNSTASLQDFALRVCACVFAPPMLFSRCRASHSCSLEPFCSPQTSTAVMSTILGTPTTRGSRRWPFITTATRTRRRSLS